MKKIEIVKVSCCGANELIEIDDVVAFLVKNPKAEIGVGVSEKKCSIDSPRYLWTKSLIENMNAISSGARIALHINGIWPRKVVETGKLPEPVINLLKSANGLTRVQLNASGNGFSLENIDPKPLNNLINALNKKARFIIPFNKESASFVKSLSLLTKDFDVLYDSSYGFGIQASKYVSLFPNQLQGYAGGLSGDNIHTELDKINNVQPFCTKIWVDAEGKLRNDNRNTLDLEKAQNLLTNTFNHQTQTAESSLEQ